MLSPSIKVKQYESKGKNPGPLKHDPNNLKVRTQFSDLYNPATNATKMTNGTTMLNQASPDMGSPVDISNFNANETMNSALSSIDQGRDGHMHKPEGPVMQKRHNRNSKTRNKPENMQTYNDQNREYYDQKADLNQDQNKIKNTLNQQRNLNQYMANAGDDTIKSAQNMGNSSFYSPGASRTQHLHNTIGSMDTNKKYSDSLMRNLNAVNRARDRADELRDTFNFTADSRKSGAQDMGYSGSAHSKFQARGPTSVASATQSKFTIRATPLNNSRINRSGQSSQLNERSQLADDQESFSATKKLHISNEKLRQGKSSRMGSLPPHVALFADFVENSTNNDLDTFLTRVNTMPMNSQNKLLQEKLILMNEKLANVFEEIQAVQSFHGKLGSFFKHLKQTVVNRAVIKLEVGEAKCQISDIKSGTTTLNSEEDEEPNIQKREVTLDSESIQMIEQQIYKSMRSLDQFNVFFQGLQQNPAVRATIQSEVQRLNDLKNCEYHRMKIKQFMGDYNKCVEENLRLKESNMKLIIKKQNMQKKFDIQAKKINVLLHTTQPVSLDVGEVSQESIPKIMRQNDSRGESLDGRVSVISGKETLDTRRTSKGGLVVEQHSAETIAEKTQNLAAVLTLKVLDQMEHKAAKNDITREICSLIEEKVDVGKCIILNKGKTLFEGGDGANFRIYIPINQDTVFSNAFNSQRAVVYNDFRHDRTILKSFKQYVNMQKVYNIMFLPITTQASPEAQRIMILINQYKPRSSRKEMGVPMNFNINIMPCSNQIFQCSLVNSLNLAEASSAKQSEFALESRVLRLMDNILTSGSTYAFQQSMEHEFMQIFQCERVNILLVNRFKKFFFKLTKDPKTGSETIHKFGMQQGLAGYAAAAGSYVLCEDVHNDVRFEAALDDPKGEGTSPAVQILTHPVYARNDHSQVGPDALQNYPRVIIQLVNRLPDKLDAHARVTPELKDLLQRNAQFGIEDCERLEQLSFLLGRAHEVLQKVEQLHVMPKLTQALGENAQLLSGHLEKHQRDFQAFGKDLAAFQERTGTSEREATGLSNQLQRTLLEEGRKVVFADQDTNEFPPEYAAAAKKALNRLAKR